MRGWFFRVGVLLLGSCASTPEGSVELVTGGEDDTFTRAPTPRTIAVEAVDEKGGRSTLFSGQVGASLDLGEQDRTLFRSLEVRAKDDSGSVVVRGASLFFQYGALDGSGPLKIFVQRTGELARLPQALGSGRADPLVELVGGRVIVVAGGGVKETDAYDLLSLRPLSSPPVLGRPPRSLVVFDRHLLAIDDTGASDLDLVYGTRAEIPVPTGATYAEVAGGQTVYASDGTAFVVGATRSTGPETARILVVAATGVLSFVSLSTPRKGAAAAWVEGQGVVVVGGSKTGPGAELLTVGATRTTAVAAPIDDRPTHAAVRLDGGRVLIVTDPRVIDLGCATTCPAEDWAKLPVPLTRARAYTAPDLPLGAVVVGNDDAGITRLFVLKKDSVRELPLKVPRKGAGSLGMPTGGIGVVAGGSGVIESFLP